MLVDDDDADTGVVLFDVDVAPEDEVDGVFTDDAAEDVISGLMDEFDVEVFVDNVAVFDVLALAAVFAVFDVVDPVEVADELALEVFGISALDEDDGDCL